MSTTPNDEQLVSSYLVKQQNNETPTAAETKAYQRALDARVLRQLKSVTPSFFNQLFGIQNKQRFDWEIRYEFPCGRSRKAIDVTAVIEAIKHLIAVNRKSIGTGQAPGQQVADDDIDINEAKRLEAIERRKKTEVQREKIQLELAVLRRQQIPIEDVRGCFEMICNVWMRISKQLQKTGHEDAWEIVEAGLEESRESFENEMTATVDDDVDKAVSQLQSEMKQVAADDPVDEAIA